MLFFLSQVEKNKTELNDRNKISFEYTYSNEDEKIDSF